SVDLDTLAEGVQVRLRVEAGWNPRRAQDRREQRRRRAFALGTGDVRDAIRPLRIVEQREQRSHAGDIVLAVAAEFARELPGALGAAEAVEPGQRFPITQSCVAHACASDQPRTTASAMRATRAISLTS